MLKLPAIIVGCILVVLAFVTTIPNILIGKYAYFATDLNHNLLHLVVGFVFLFFAYVFEARLKFLFRYFGYFFIFVAVFGAWSTGMETGDVLGIFATNGIGHIFNLVFGTVLFIIGTSDLRD